MVEAMTSEVLVFLLLNGFVRKLFIFWEVGSKRNSPIPFPRGRGLERHLNRFCRIISVTAQQFTTNLINLIFTGEKINVYGIHHNFITGDQHPQANQAGTNWLQPLQRPVHPGRLQAIFTVHQHAPALTSIAPRAANRRLEILLRILQDLVVKRAWLQPHSWNIHCLRFLQDLPCHLWRGNNRQGCLRGRREFRGRFHGGIGFGT